MLLDDLADAELDVAVLGGSVALVAMASRRGKEKVPTTSAGRIPRPRSVTA